MGIFDKLRKKATAATFGSGDQIVRVQAPALLDLLDAADERDTLRARVAEHPMEHERDEARLSGSIHEDAARGYRAGLAGDPEPRGVSDVGLDAFIRANEVRRERDEAKDDFLARHEARAGCHGRDADGPGVAAERARVKVLEEALRLAMTPRPPVSARCEGARGKAAEARGGAAIAIDALEPARVGASDDTQAAGWTGTDAGGVTPLGAAADRPARDRARERTVRLHRGLHGDVRPVRLPRPRAREGGGTWRMTCGATKAAIDAVPSQNPARFDRPEGAKGTRISPTSSTGRRRSGCFMACLTVALRMAKETPDAR
jgi:hypothetical protein